MKFCPSLFYQINFEPRAIQPCCDTRALKVPQFPYEGGPVDLAAYAKFISGVLEEIQAGGKTCEGCPQLKETQGLPDASGLKFATVSINMHRHHCNCRCSYCPLWQAKDKSAGYDILPGLKSLRDAGALATNCRVHWGGGEPSILPGFDKAAIWAFDNGYFQYIHSNALRHSPALGAILAKGGARLNVSLDSASPAVYKKVKGVDGFERVVNNLKLYMKEKPHALDLKYIIFEANNSIEEIDGFLRLARDLRPRAIKYSLNFQEVNAGKVSDETLRGAAFMQKQASQLGLKCEPQFIDKPWQDKINALAATM